jgi:hypothetical protein
MKKLPDDNPAGSKHEANVPIKTNDIKITFVIYYEFVVSTVVRI